MKYLELLKNFESYYGLKYSTEKSEVILTYLTLEWREKHLNMLADFVLKKHSSSYKSLPDIGIIESVKADVIAAIKSADSEARGSMLQIGDQRSAFDRRQDALSEAGYDLASGKSLWAQMQEKSRNRLHQCN